MQTEKAKSSHFDRTRGDKSQIFPTLIPAQNRRQKVQQPTVLIYTLCLVGLGEFFTVTN